MAVVHKYRVWCVTEGAWVFVWSETEPVKCPNDTNDTIDPGRVAIVESAGNAQAFTEEGAAITTPKNKGELTGNIVLLKQMSVVLAGGASSSKTWVIPDGKQWNIRIFSASSSSANPSPVADVVADLECWENTTLTTAPPGLPTLVRVNPFNDDADEPVATLKMQASAAQAAFYESLPFVGENQRELRIVFTNNANNKPSEISAFINGYESAV